MVSLVVANYTFFLITAFVYTTTICGSYAYLCLSILFMKKLVTVTVSLFSFLIAASQSVTGNWEGVMDANGTELTIVFHIAKDSTGKLSGTFDSPKQMAYGLKCSNISVTADSVLVEMKAFGAKYKGQMGADKKTLTGNWSQGGMSLPLNLTKTSELVILQETKRPQTPKPPFSYSTEDVTYTNADKSISFGGTFTRPSLWADKVKNMKYPVAILITGSGQQDRDETLFEHKPFAVIADHLAKQGIATLRVDDREKGVTTGRFRQATTLDFAKDVEAGIDYIKTRGDVDLKNIGLIGHSEGGMIAPMVAAKRKDVKFIVLLAGPGVPVIELMEQQTIDISLSNGVSKAEIEKFRPLYKPLMMAALNESDSAVAAEKIINTFVSWQKNTDSATVKNTTGVTDKASLNEFAANIIAEVKQPWFNYFIRFRPADYLNNVHCAVLALNGEKDIQVAAAPNLEAIRKIMTEKMVRTFKVQALPGLNHLFQHCNSCTGQEYAQLEETFSPEALSIISSWIKGVVAK
jgi:pimeloyl-ACP methyl ester carboxylesterase